MEQKEKKIAFWISVMGTIFVIANLYFKGISIENTFDALKDISGFAISIIIVFIAVEIEIGLKYSDFKSKFSFYLNEWISHNDYLVDANKKTIGENDTKEFYYMLTKPHHKNIVLKEKKASDFHDKGGQINSKHAFLYIDTKDKQEIIFGLSKSSFILKAGEELPNKQTLFNIAEIFSKRIEDEFGSKLNLKAKPLLNDGTRIIVSINKIKKTSENAKLLVDLVEFVKTMILAYA